MNVYLDNRMTIFFKSLFFYHLRISCMCITSTSLNPVQLFIFVYITISIWTKQLSGYHSRLGPLSQEQQHAMQELGLVR